MDRDAFDLEKGPEDLFECEFLESCHSASQDIPEHSEIAHKTIEWMLESGRTVFFKTKVSYPRKAITKNWKYCEKDQIPGKEEKKKKSYHSAGPDKVKSPAGNVRVFFQIIRVKITKTFKFHGFLFGTMCSL